MKEKLEKYRISPDEYQKICQLLDREPQGVEWALFSALWSEHCSYKSSRFYLKKFKTTSTRVLEGMGENAGVVDLGLGERVAFKMESHNHPSFIEPVQGAATGVGGILRDIFTMGARPIALANYLCFGNPKAHRMSELVEGVVKGISFYGNCVGVANITGQTEFHSSYDGNILVNAFALGYFGPEDQIANSRAQGIGNLIIYVGAKTGRDGIHAASMASESFDQNSESKRPTIQIGDPFYEKLLIEACLEIIQQNLVVAIQDMGAAGLTSSTFEMAQKGGVGFRIDLDRVPLRDLTLTPEEILLSESQERMLLIAEPKNLKAIQDVFTKYTLDAAVIGEVVEGQDVELRYHQKTLTKINPHLLTEGAPLYQRPFTEPEIRMCEKLTPLDNTDALGLFLQMISSPQGCSRNFIYEQYDQRVGGRTARDCRSPVGVVKLPSDRLLGIAMGFRPTLMRLCPHVGSVDSVISACLKLSALGFEPLATTDCLNFGSPENKAIMGEFIVAVDQIAKAAEVFHAPVISGNVSLYNQTLDKSITNTPSVGVVGIKTKMELTPSSTFTDVDQNIFVLSSVDVTTFGDLSELLKLPLEHTGKIHLQAQADFAKHLRQMAQNFTSVRVVTKFGIPYALFRMCTEELGCSVNLNVKDLSELFVEKLYQVIVTGPKNLPELFPHQAFVHIGSTKKTIFEIVGHIKTDVMSLIEHYNKGFGDHFAKLS